MKGNAFFGIGQMPIFKHFNFVHTNSVVLQNGLVLGLSYPEKMSPNIQTYKNYLIEMTLDIFILGIFIDVQKSAL